MSTIAEIAANLLKLEQLAEASLFIATQQDLTVLRFVEDTQRRQRNFVVVDGSLCTDANCACDLALASYRLLACHH